MDPVAVHSAVTVLALLAFVAVVAWAYNSARTADFERAARSLLEDDEATAGEDKR